MDDFLRELQRHENAKDRKSLFGQHSTAELRIDIARNLIEEGANTHYKVWIRFPIVIVGIIYDCFRVVSCFPHFSEARGRKIFQ